MENFLFSRSRAKFLISASFRWHYSFISEQTNSKKVKSQPSKKPNWQKNSLRLRFSSSRILLFFSLFILWSCFAIQHQDAVQTHLFCLVSQACWKTNAQTMVHKHGHRFQLLLSRPAVVVMFLPHEKRRSLVSCCLHSSFCDSITWASRKPLVSISSRPTCKCTRMCREAKRGFEVCHMLQRSLWSSALRDSHTQTSQSDVKNKTKSKQKRCCCFPLLSRLLPHPFVLFWIERLCHYCSG